MIDIIKEGFTLIKLKKNGIFLFFIITILISALELLGIGFIFIFLDILLNEDGNLKAIEILFYDYLKIEGKKIFLFILQFLQLYAFLFEILF